MSVSFWIADTEGKIVRECDCHERYGKANAAFWSSRNAEGYLTGEEPNPFDYECDKCRLGVREINLNNRNACDLLAWLDLPTEEYGSLPAREMAARCKRRTWDVARNLDAGIEPQAYKVPNGPQVYSGGREPGYLRHRVEQLLQLAEKAGDGQIVWG